MKLDETKYYPLNPIGNHNKRAIKTGEWRGPKEGEWYLSGASPQAYRAVADMETPYYIVKIVCVRVRFVEQVEIIG